jgi:uncharacterized membrane protein YjgN (DUF898 family)
MAARNHMTEQEPVAAPVENPPLAPSEMQLQFTGTGAEYFRIWIVHTLLTLMTLGVYSAWAKARKMRWFAQHTRLDGDAFEYHGRPTRILLGRVVALVLILAYGHAFDWSKWAGLSVIVLLLLLGPLLFASAQRFRLANTSWRGVHFGFAASRREVYQVCLPALAVWTSATVWAAFVGTLSGTLWLGGLTALAFPWIHASLKTLQHRRATFGDQNFTFRKATLAFYGVYAGALGIAVLAGIGASIMASLIKLAGDSTDAGTTARMVSFVGSLIAAFVFYLSLWPYLSARIQRTVWSRTRLGPVGFRNEISASALTGLVLRNAVLVVITAGLYWPHAAVIMARYRIRTLVLEIPQGLPEIKGVAQDLRTGATGDAASNLLDLDLGW